MDSLVVPNLSLLKHWLEQMNIVCFECDTCQSLHLPHMRNTAGVTNSKLDIIDGVILFSAQADLQLSEYETFAIELNNINSLSILMRVFIEGPDEDGLRLYFTQSLNTRAGVSISQILQFLQDAEEQIAILMSDERIQEQVLNSSEAIVHEEPTATHLLH